MNFKSSPVELKLMNNAEHQQMETLLFSMTFFLQPFLFFIPSSLSPPRFLFQSHSVSHQKGTGSIAGVQRGPHSILG